MDQKINIKSNNCTIELTSYCLKVNSRSIEEILKESLKNKITPYEQLTAAIEINIELHNVEPLEFTYIPAAAEEIAGVKVALLNNSAEQENEIETF